MIRYKGRKDAMRIFRSRGHSFAISVNKKCFALAQCRRKWVLLKVRKLQVSHVYLVQFNCFQSFGASIFIHHRFLLSFLHNAIMATFERGSLPSGNPLFVRSARFFSLRCFRSSATDQPA